MRLEGKVALVTGAGQGIGRAIGITFAREGANVIINDINGESAGKVAEEIRALGRQALPVVADISGSSAVERMVEASLAAFQRVDILVNNAAPTERVYALMEETSEAMLDRYINICLKGTFLCSKAIGRQMVKHKYGKIINMSSIYARDAAPGRICYGICKAGIVQMTKTLAVEWGKYNINVNAVSPGVTLSPQHQALIDDSMKSVRKHRLDRYPIKRFNQPEDVANTVLFLASSEAENITGQDIIVDSGIDALWSGYDPPVEPERS